MKNLNLFSIIALSASLCSCDNRLHESGPSNAPAMLLRDGNTITMIYDGSKILSLVVNTKASDFSLNELKDTRSDRVTHLFTISSLSGEPLDLEGTMVASSESFACEADRRIEGTQVVRHSYGMSHNLLNRAVYDRQSDWLLSADQSYTSANLSVIPLSSDSLSRSYKIKIRGDQVTIRFRPHYYQKHRGLKYFKPWEYNIWKDPVAGWCSWFAFKTGITEENVKETAEVIAETMMPYGLEYLQIDDGYQQEGGQPEKWITPNEKFPSGLESLASYIESLGLKPGIWTNVAIHDSNFVAGHKKWFVTDKSGEPAIGWWIGYIPDGSNTETLDSVITPVYSHFRNTGWKYFKLDALRHLLYEGYNSHSEYFVNRGVDREKAFRNVVERVRDDVGRDNFLLACWGVLPAVVGLADGCRIGNDGFGYAALAQYNSFNNIIWRNDPDHIELSPEEAYRSCMVTSLTGSVFMVTDKPEKYLTDLIVPAQKSLPVLFTKPGQVFDLDPSRSMMLDNSLTEMSGSGERAFDGNRTTPFDLFMLELNMPWESWIVLGRTGCNEKEIQFADLGLSTEHEYLVYEFWSGRYLGSYTEKLVFEEPDPAFNCQLYCIREKTNHPQLLATDRHISCGAYDLSDVRWENNILSGKSKTVAGENYTIVIYEPESYRKPIVNFTNSEIVSDKVAGSIRKITIVSRNGDEVLWKLTY